MWMSISNNTLQMFHIFRYTKKSNQINYQHRLTLTSFQHHRQTQNYTVRSAPLISSYAVLLQGDLYNNEKFANLFTQILICTYAPMNKTLIPLHTQFIATYPISNWISCGSFLTPHLYNQHSYNVHGKAALSLNR
jgi:hypothetical protein